MVKNGVEENGSRISLQCVMLKGSMKEKFPLSFIIKSANLRMRDTIGEGWSSVYNIIKYSCYDHVCMHGVYRIS